MKDIYTLKYYELMLRQNSGSAELINKIRWDFVADAKPKNVLDYGCGCGWFRAWKPEGVEVDTFDVMDVPQTGINEGQYDLTTFWDVIEHVDWENAPDKEMEKVFKKSKYVAVTVPVLPEGQDVNTWKHTKPGEHLTRFENIDDVIAFFEMRGFKIIKVGTPECTIRSDIYSFLFKCVK